MEPKYIQGGGCLEGRNDFTSLEGTCGRLFAAQTNWGRKIRLNWRKQEKRGLRLVALLKSRYRGLTFVKKVRATSRQREGPLEKKGKIAGRGCSGSQAMVDVRHGGERSNRSSERDCHMKKGDISEKKWD